MTYDTAGNITQDALTGGTMTYDAENRLLTATNGGGGSYTYDGEGRRVKRVTAGQTWWYVYGINGELLAEYQSGAPTTVRKEYGYRGGQLLIVWDNDKAGNERLKWLVTDHLGSTRMEADLSGSLTGMRRHDYLPFGEELTSAHGAQRSGVGYEPPSSNVRQKFTGYERDLETGLDYAQARYLANVQGRFTSPDPLLNSGRPNLPQSWNRYTYTLNNPMKYIDPDGLYEWGASLGGRKSDNEVGEEIRWRRELFNVALEKAKGNLEAIKKTFGGESSEEYKKAKKAVDAYGTLGDKNKVFVGAGNEQQEDAGMTRPGSNGNIYVTFRGDVFTDAAADSKGFQSLISHEGWHVVEFKNGITEEGWNSEYSAVYVQAAMGAALYPNGRGYFTVGTGTDQKQAVIWNSTWGEADRIVERDKGIRQYLQAPRSEGGKGLTPPKGQ